MKNKVAYTMLLMVLSSTLIFSQKPSFDLLPSGKQNRIPEAIVNAKYYNDSSVVIRKPMSDSFRIEKEQPIFQEAEESDKLIDSLARKMFYLIFTTKIDYSFSTLYRSFIKY